MNNLIGECRWNASNLHPMNKQVLPYSESSLGKKEQVAQMFNNIASRYDLMNTLLSLGIYNIWKRKLVKELRHEKPQLILDVATGTADIAIALLKLNPEKIIGGDISKEMIAFGEKKIEQLNLQKKIELLLADAEQLPFEDNKFDAVTVAYGVRNFGNLDKGLNEMLRVLKPNGKVVILEFSKPRNKIINGFFNFYFNRICPLIGSWITGDKSAYTYLPQSVKVFPDGKQFENILQSIGFVKTKCTTLSFGVASIYTGYKS